MDSLQCEFLNAASNRCKCYVQMLVTFLTCVRFLSRVEYFLFFSNNLSLLLVCLCNKYEQKAVVFYKGEIQANLSIL